MSSSRRTFLRIGSSALIIAGMVAVVLRERETAGAVGSHMTSAGVAAVLQGAVLSTIGYAVLPLVGWSSICRHITGVDMWPVALAWLKPAVAKYVPGFVWHAATTVEQLQRHGATVSTASLAVAVNLCVAIASALVTGAVAFPALLAARGRASLWLVLAVPAIAILHPRVFSIALRGLGRVTGQRLTVTISWRFLAKVFAFYFVAWVLMGAGLHSFLRGLDADASILPTITFSALSWVAGYIFIIAPAGLGVREATLTALLATSIQVEIALAAALLWRLTFVAADLAMFATGAIGEVIMRRHRAPP